MTKTDATATAWIDNQHRVIYRPREIRRGRRKGKLEVYYRKGYNFKKAIISKSDIQEYFDQKPQKPAAV